MFVLKFRSFVRVGRSFLFLMCPFFWKQSTRVATTQTIVVKPLTTHFTTKIFSNRKKRSPWKKKYLTKCAFYFHCCMNISSKWSLCIVSLTWLKNNAFIIRLKCIILRGIILRLEIKLWFIPLTLMIYHQKFAISSFGE